MMELLDRPIQSNIKKACNALIYLFIGTAATTFAGTVISSAVSSLQEYHQLVTEYKTKGRTVDYLWRQCIDEKLKGCDTIFNHDSSSNPYLLALRMVFANSYYCGSQPCVVMLVDTWNSLSIGNFLVALGVLFMVMFLWMFFRSVTMANQFQIPTVNTSGGVGNLSIKNHED